MSRTFSWDFLYQKFNWWNIFLCKFKCAYRSIYELKMRGRVGKTAVFMHIPLSSSSSATDKRTASPRLAYIVFRLIPDGCWPSRTWLPKVRSVMIVYFLWFPRRDELHYAARPDNDAHRERHLIYVSGFWICALSNHTFLKLLTDTIHRNMLVVVKLILKEKTSSRMLSVRI